MNIFKSWQEVDYLFAGFVALVIFFCLSIPLLGWKASCVSAKIYNQQNDTEWTCGDFFFAGSQINSQTQTINVK